MIKWYVFILIFLSNYCFAQDREFILWNKNQVIIAPVNNLSVTVSEKVHYSPKKKSIQSKYGEILIGHQVLNWLEYGTGFRITSVNKQVNEWLTENRPMVFIDFGKDLNNFEFDLSNRFEYRVFKPLENYFRYRHSFQMKFPAITELGVQFYLQEESFLKLNGDGAHLARFFSGLTTYDRDFVEIKIYYALQKHEVFNQWLTTDILGLNLSFEI